MSQLTKFLIALWTIFGLLGIGIAMYNDDSSWQTIKIMAILVIFISLFGIIGTKIANRR